MSTNGIRLTQYSHGAGCGCKIAPAALDEILKSSVAVPDNQKLLVGNRSKDDAAVYDLDNGLALISTTDFFMPIVDDPFEFGRVAAANSISDIYAMGGKPILAVAILGWPMETLDPGLARLVVEGGRAVCQEAGIPLAGGHSIDSPEPIFGLAVNGLVAVEHLKRNNTAQSGDHLFLTKPLGVGILSTAQKRNVLKDDHSLRMITQMTTLNKLGEQLGALQGVTAMTDVTGFGLLGHLIEMAEGSGLSAEIYYGRIPLIEGVREYISQRISTDATTRNWSSYNNKVKFEGAVNVMEAFAILPDPQTNGGLLFSVDEKSIPQVRKLLQGAGFGDFVEPIGKMVSEKEKSVYVLP